MNAMILAAGFGTRLRPHTLRYPKPIIPILDRRLIDFNLALLKRIGVQNVALNLHYLADEIENYLATIDTPIRFAYNREPQIMNTGGGLKGCQHLVENGPLVLIHGDVYCEFDLAPILDFHAQHDALVTMVLKRPAPDLPVPTVTRGADLKITTIAGLPRRPEPSDEPAIFTGVHVISPELFDHIPGDAPCCLVREIYPQLIGRTFPIYGYFDDARWSDLGTPESYRKTVLELAQRPEEIGAFFGMSIDSVGATLAGDAKIDNATFFGENCSVGAGCDIRNSVFGDGCQVDAGVVINQSIIGPGVRVSQPLDHEIIMFNNV